MTGSDTTQDVERGFDVTRDLRRNHDFGDRINRVELFLPVRDPRSSGRISSVFDHWKQRLATECTASLSRRRGAPTLPFSLRWVVREGQLGVSSAVNLAIAAVGRHRHRTRWNFSNRAIPCGGGGLRTSLSESQWRLQRVCRRSCEAPILADRARLGIGTQFSGP